MREAATKCKVDIHFDIRCQYNKSVESSDRRFFALIAAGGVVYVGSDDFKMYALDAATGKEI
jgi:outer membrane protein assembly factor BamB